MCLQAGEVGDYQLYGPEHFERWDIHAEGTQPSVRAVTNALDAERVRVREALALLFDFQWANKNLFNGAYTRTHSYFDNSELAVATPEPGTMLLMGVGALGAAFMRRRRSA